MIIITIMMMMIIIIVIIIIVIIIIIITLSGDDGATCRRLEGAAVGEALHGTDSSKDQRKGKCS